MATEPFATGVPRSQVSWAPGELGPVKVGAKPGQSPPAASVQVADTGATEPRPAGRVSTTVPLGNERPSGTVTTTV